MHQWEVFSFALLVGLLVLVCTAPVLRVVEHARACATATFPSGTVVMLSPVGDVRTSLEKLVCGTPVTHVGIVWVDARGVAFMLHTMRAGGARLEPFIPWVARATRRNQVFIQRLTGPPVDGAAMEAAFVPYLGMNYSFGFWKAVMHAWWPGVEMPRAASPPDRFCSELVAEVLQDLGVLDFAPSQTAPRLTLPADFWSPSRLPMAVPYVFAEREEVTRDLFFLRRTTSGASAGTTAAV